MLTHYLGPRARYIRPVARGGYYNKGEGIRMALAVGRRGLRRLRQLPRRAARSALGRDRAGGDGFQLRHPGQQATARASSMRRRRRSTPPTRRSPASSSSSPKASPIAFSIPRSTTCRTGSARCAPTSRRSRPRSLPELAGKLGIDARELAATVEAYNAACPAGTFKPLELDGSGDARRPGAAQDATGRARSTSRRSSPSRSSAAIASPSAA